MIETTSIPMTSERASRFMQRVLSETPHEDGSFKNFAKPLAKWIGNVSGVVVDPNNLEVKALPDGGIEITGVPMDALRHFQMNPQKTCTTPKRHLKYGG